MSEEIRYWDRIGIYVTRKFAQEFIDRSQETGVTGEYLDSEFEEFEQSVPLSVHTLQREVEELFSKPYEAVELPLESQVMFDVIHMERNKKETLRGFMADGLDKDEAKEKYTNLLNEMVGDALGTSGEESEDSEETPHEEE